MGSKYPKNNLFNFEKGSTGGEVCLLRLSDQLRAPKTSESFFSKLILFILGYFVFFFFYIIKKIHKWGDLSDISDKTATLTTTLSRCDIKIANNRTHTSQPPGPLSAQARSPDASLRSISKPAITIKAYDQCLFLSRNIRSVTPKIIYLYYLKKYFFGSKYPKNHSK